MDLGAVEENVSALDTSQGFDLIFDLLLAYGMPNASVARLRKGSLNQSDREHELLWKTKVYYRFISAHESGLDLHKVIDDAASEARITKQRPRFLIVCDSERLVADDTKTGEKLDIELPRLPSYASFFLPWAGIEKTQLETLHYADVKAAEKMARLYDEIRNLNDLTSDDAIHALNVFFTRLLFCFFAEDTGIFEKGAVTQAIGSLTRADGEDMHSFFDQLFVVLDTPRDERDDLPSYLEGFGYVNGSLFSGRTAVPRFTAKARSIVLECGELDWSEINPDIFGSMMQAVVHPGQRAGLGMHYTSVENIMKVLRPLFLDSLEDAFQASVGDPKKLRRLLQRLSSIKVFDPACGSGNFLVIAYKELRSLEHRTLERLQELDDDPLGSGLFKESAIKLDHFYGIEIDDFAHEVARLALWLAKHQMNGQFERLFGPRLQMIPLKDAGQITCANAARVDWEKVCPAEDDAEIFVCGNPPYLGARVQDRQQKSDVQSLSGFGAISNNLDYVAIWLLKAASFVAQHNATAGLVATNSVSQGEQVALLFPKIYDAGADIAFAHRSFRWSNNARNNAGVTCVVIGLRAGNRLVGKRRLYSDGHMIEVDAIGPYLVPTRSRTIVQRSQTPLNGLPIMLFGSMPNDGGFLILSASERSALLESHPEASKYIRSFLGTREFLHGIERYVLWLSASDLDDALRVPMIAQRLEAVKLARLRSAREATKKLASVPYRFAESRHRETSAIIVPEVSSERRKYVPIGFLGPEIVVSNKGFVIYDAQPWLFALVQSRMHMVWLRAVGGQLETRLSYANTLVYNTFPVPDLSDADKTRLTAAALKVLVAREQFSEQTLAELYDPEEMPEVLRESHRRLDEVVDLLYDAGGFDSDDDRLTLLFKMYETLTAPTQELISA